HTIHSAVIVQTRRAKRRSNMRLSVAFAICVGISTADTLIIHMHLVAWRSTDHVQATKSLKQSFIMHDLQSPAHLVELVTSLPSSYTSLVLPSGSSLAITIGISRL